MKPTHPNPKRPDPTDLDPRVILGYRRLLAAIVVGSTRTHRAARSS